MEDANAFSPHTMGDPQVEYGVVDMSSNYPSREIEWTPELPMDAPTERHLVVPFEVVRRGFTSGRLARRTADHMNDEAGHDRYRAVMLSDPRGI